MFCVFLNVRYSNPKLMHVGHQYVESNFEPSTFKGLVSIDANFISPDKGLGIFTFDNQVNIEKHISVIKVLLKTMRIDFHVK